MNKLGFVIMVVAVFALAACTHIDYTANTSGASDYATVAVKDFVTLGIVTVTATEIHHSSPFGLVKTVKGSKVTYADLLQEAARLEADDVINVRIDMNASYTKGALDWLTGWTRVYNHTGTALAIKYASKLDSESVDPQLRGLPREPEESRASPRGRSGRR
ncbi:MAG: hypothetical protein LBI06_04765 [Treponema sp.]|nr:hypothetical protein [Treponema sp.]